MIAKIAGFQLKIVNRCNNRIEKNQGALSVNGDIPCISSFFDSDIV